MRSKHTTLNVSPSRQAWRCPHAPSGAYGLPIRAQTTQYVKKTSKRINITAEVRPRDMYAQTNARTWKQYMFGLMAACTALLVPPSLSREALLTERSTSPSGRKMPGIQAWSMCQISTSTHSHATAWHGGGEKVHVRRLATCGSDH